MEELITVDELAEKLKVAKSWVYGYSRQTGPGSIPRLKVGISISDSIIAPSWIG